MHKEGLETYNDSIKILILLLCTSTRQHKDIEFINTCTSITAYNHNFHYSLQLHVLIVILSILFCSERLKLLSFDLM